MNVQIFVLRLEVHIKLFSVPLLCARNGRCVDNQQAPVERQIESGRIVSFLGLRHRPKAMAAYQPAEPIAVHRLE